MIQYIEFIENSNKILNNAKFQFINKARELCKNHRIADKRISFGN